MHHHLLPGIRGVHHMGGHTDWLSIVLGAAAIATGLAFIGGLYLTVNYARRATASVTATATPLAGGGFLLAMRPVVKAVGILRVKFRKGTGAQLIVFEVWVDTRYSGDPKTRQIGIPITEIFGDPRKVRVEPGEELGTEVVLRVLPPSPLTVGWAVALSVDGRRRWWLPWVPSVWNDRVFVPRPGAPAGGNNP